MATANVVQTSISGGHSNALAIQGDGAFLPKLDTASRLALTLGTPDKGLMVYDTTLTTICVWNGVAWEFVGDNSNGWVSVKDFGAKGDGVTNDAPAIQTALDYVVNTGNQGILLFPAGNYKCNAGLTVKCAFTGCFGERAVLDFSSLGDVPAITFTGGGRYDVGNPWNQATFSFDGFAINGPSTTSATGLYLNDLTPAVNGGPSHTAFRNLQITKFRTGIYFGNRTYLESFDHFDIWDVTYGIWYPINDLSGNPLSDSGENISFYNGCIYNCSQYDFYCENSARSSDFSFNSCSFDGNGSALIYNNGGVIGFNSCHFEGIASRAIINALGFITINGGFFTDNGNKTLVGFIQNNAYMAIYGGRIASSGRSGIIFSNSNFTLFGTHIQTDQIVANQIIATGNYNYWVANVGTQQLSGTIVANTVESSTVGLGKVITLTTVNVWVNLGYGVKGGLYVFRDNTIGGTAVFAADSQAGATSIQNGITGFQMQYSAVALDMQIRATAGVFPRNIAVTLVNTNLV